jgi:hypothetical protein
MRVGAFRLLLAVALAQAAGCIPLRVEDTPRVQGVVVDAATNRPVQGARVYFEDFPAHAAISGADGRFTLPAVRSWRAVPLVGVWDRFDLMRLSVESPHYERATLEYGHTGDIDDVRIPLKPQS